MYLLLFHQADRFKFPLQKYDAQGKPQSVIHWTSLVRKNIEEYSFSDYVNQFLHMSLCLLSTDVIPRISTEIRRILHLIEQAKIGDWYLYQNYTEIRIYGCELPPYMLPVFVPTRIFALEYIRQIMNMHDLYFVSRKQKTQFTLKAQIGPFIVKTRVAAKEADILLKQMKFKSSFTWSYDPLGIISKLRVEHKTTPYVHTARPEIKQYANQKEWQENTL